MGGGCGKLRSGKAEGLAEGLVTQGQSWSRRGCSACALFGLRLADPGGRPEIKYKSDEGDGDGTKSCTSEALLSRSNPGQGDGGQVPPPRPPGTPGYRHLGE